MTSPSLPGLSFYSSSSARSFPSFLPFFFSFFCFLFLSLFFSSSLSSFSFPHLSFLFCPYSYRLFNFPSFLTFFPSLWFSLSQSLLFFIFIFRLFPTIFLSSLSSILLLLLFSPPLQPSIFPPIFFLLSSSSSSPLNLAIFHSLLLLLSLPSFLFSLPHTHPPPSFFTFHLLFHSS